MFKPFHRNCSVTTQREILRVYVSGKTGCSAEGGLTQGGLGECSPRKFFNLGSRKCHFQRFPQDIFRKNIFRCLFYQSPVLSASESDDYGIILKIKEILTQEHQYMAKIISVIPRFSRLRRSPLARARILPCPKEK